MEEQKKIEAQPVTVTKIVPPSVILYNPQGIYLGVLNEYEFHDVRAQIKENQASGYYVEYKGMDIRIDKNGELERWPSGMFDQISNTLMKLI